MPVTRIVLRSLLRCLLGLLILSPLPVFAQTEGTPWTGTWSTAASWQDASDYTSWTGTSALTFSQQTVRQYVFTSIGGTAARLHFSNQYGLAPLTISDVHLGQMASANGDVLAGSDRVVTFSGATSITIAPGATVTSDAIAGTVPPRSYMVISTYFPGATPARLTLHFFAYQSALFVSGDQSGQAQFPFPPNNIFPTSYFFLTGMDVQSPGAAGALVQLGASVTDGMNSTINANHRSGNFMAQNLQAAGINVGVLDEGIPGSNMLIDNNPPYGDGAVKRFTRDVLAQAGARWVIYSEYNDVNNSFTDLQNGILQMMNWAHGQQLKFICATTTPFSPPGTGSSPPEATRQQLNAWLRSANNGCDGLLDQDLTLRDPNDPASYDSRYDSGDHLHPNDLGYQLIANALATAIFTQPTPLATANPSTQCTVLAAGQNLNVGGSITSCDGRFTLSLLAGGNLVLRQGATTLWSVQTGGVQGRMLPDGNFVFADADGRPTWATNSDGHANAALLVQNDGNLVIYDSAWSPVWNSGTCCH